MAFDLAKLALTQMQIQIIRIILRLFGAGRFFRSPEYTLDQIAMGFPDHLEGAVRQTVFKMQEEYILMKMPDRDGYVINPNKVELVRWFLSPRLAAAQPVWQFVPENFEKEPVFEREGAKDTNGVKSKYYYYRSSSDPYHFCVLIQSRINTRPEKKDLGSLSDQSSVIFQVWSAIDKKIETDRFKKADLNNLVPTAIVENRQPIKAAIDVLEYLGYIEKAGPSKGKSQEYRKTSKHPPDSGLEKYFGGDNK